MKAETVLMLHKLLQNNGIDVVVDGGWGIDALLGEQSRPHGDLDIAIQHKYVEKLRALFKERGYEEKQRNDSSDYNFVLADSSGNEIDVHSYTFDDKGNNVYGIAYPLESLKGKGSINNHPVRCIALEWVIKFHENYEPDEDDHRDIEALCNKFNISPPSNY